MEHGKFSADNLVEAWDFENSEVRKRRKADKIVRQRPADWIDVILDATNAQTCDENLSCFSYALRCCLDSIENSDSVIDDLICNQTSEKVGKYVVAAAVILHYYSDNEIFARLTNPTKPILFEAYSQYRQWARIQSAEELSNDVHWGEQLDFWAENFISGVLDRDLDLAWQLFLGYLAWEESAQCRGWAAIDILETICIRSPDAYIDHICQEAVRNDRLRHAMLSTYPPHHTPEIERRYKAACQWN